MRKIEIRRGVTMVTLHNRKGWQTGFAVRADDVQGSQAAERGGSIVTMVDGTTYDVRESLSAITEAMAG